MAHYWKVTKTTRPDRPATRSEVQAALDHELRKQLADPARRRTLVKVAQRVRKDSEPAEHRLSGLLARDRGGEVEAVLVEQDGRERRLRGSSELTRKGRRPSFRNVFQDQPTSYPDGTRRAR
jgi:hypothetical protein